MMSDLANGLETFKLKEVVKYSKGKKPKKLCDIHRKDTVPYIDIAAFDKGIIKQYTESNE